MTYRVVVPPHIEKQISTLHPSLKIKIRAAFDDLSKNPFGGKALKENLEGLYSYRVTRYRIIYSIHKRVLEIQVIAIGHRGTIYQSL